MIICICNNVAQSKIEQEILQGASTLKEVQCKTKACTNCGKCSQEIEGLLELLVTDNNKDITERCSDNC